MFGYFNFSFNDLNQKCVSSLFARVVGAEAVAWGWAIFVAMLFMATTCTSMADEAGEVDFNRDIRPILSNACFHCHGPDEETREADLRLDTHEGILTDLGGYAAFVPDEVDQSEAFTRIISDDPDLRMPPVDSGDALSDNQVALIRRWIEQGAEWSDHWAFVAPQRPALPTDLRDSPFIKTPIDSFVWNQLQKKSLEPSPSADRITLLRRLSFDLIGLPPTVEEVDAFVRDSRPDAYERQVDRLLSSPHFGEHWGRHWLDAARYADSDGFEQDKPRDVWFYRDWVIDALNRDMPYDQFVIEQMAGDLLPNPTQSQRVATGFLRNSMINNEGGADPEQFRMEAMFGRMNTVGTGVLGLTVGCAQCHSHKFDPISHDDYYRMFAFLNSCDKSQIAVYTPDQEQQRQQVLGEIRAIELQLQHNHPDWAKQMADWEEGLPEQPEWVVAELEVDDSAAAGQKFLPQDDGSWLSQGFSSVKSKILFFARTDMKEITALRLELLLDPNLPFGGPGRSIDGTHALSEIEVLVAARGQAGSDPKAKQRQKIAIARATADLSLPERPLADVYDDVKVKANRKPKKLRVTGPIEFALDGKPETAWSIDAGPGRRNQARKAVFVFSEPISYAEGTELSIYLNQQHGGWNNGDRQSNSVGRFRISLTNSPNPSADPLPRDVRQILAIPRNQRSSKQQEQVFSYWRTTVSQWQDANDRIEACWQRFPEVITQLVLAERDTPRDTYRLDRGDFLSRAEKVSPGVPSFLHSWPEGVEPSRLTFAQWLVDRRSPTAARTIANRIWQSYFGIGIVRTASDLGSQGEPPSHPQLLDWLAVELMDHGWSLKHLHRQIVLSATYRQSSDVSPELVALDPANRLLARGPRFRIEAETVRDAALMAGGLLDTQIGGPSVYPPAPEFLFQRPASFADKFWDFEKSSSWYRRALYTFKYRSILYPSLQTFDAPNGEATCVRRSRSNTPLQALTTLNEPLFMQCAKALALRTVHEGGTTDEGRLTYAFRRCVARQPTAEETKVLLALLARQTERFSQPGKNPWELGAIDLNLPPELPEGTTPAQLAAWTAVSRTLLNLDETISKE